MTPKSVIEIDFQEIGALEIKCSKPQCGGAVTIPVHTANTPLVLACPGCNETWWHRGSGPLFEKVDNLLKALSAWQRREEKPFTIGVTLQDGQ